MNDLAANVRRVVLATKEGVIPPDPSLITKEERLAAVWWSEDLFDFKGSLSLYQVADLIERSIRAGRIVASEKKHEKYKREGADKGSHVHGSDRGGRPKDRPPRTAGLTPDRRPPSACAAQPPANSDCCFHRRRAGPWGRPSTALRSLPDDSSPACYPPSKEKV